MRESHIAAALRPDYAAIGVPTLVVHGELDAIVPVQAAHFVAGTVPGSTLEVLPGAGHVPSVTQPDALRRRDRQVVGGRRPPIAATDTVPRR